MSPAKRPRSAAVCATPGEPHQPTSPTALTVAVRALGNGSAGCSPGSSCGPSADVGSAPLEARADGDDGVAPPQAEARAPSTATKTVRQ